MAAAMMEVSGPKREFYFFDSFKGLPDPTFEDGQEAIDWKNNTAGPRYFNNCTADRSEFLSTIQMTNNNLSLTSIIEGEFSESLKKFGKKNISLLRLDADWYISTSVALNALWPSLLPGAIVIIDDYLDWQGCRRAVHDFFSKQALTEAIRETTFGKVFYIVKR